MKQTSRNHIRVEAKDPAAGYSHHRSISPVDGRYIQQTKQLQEMFSEFGFTKQRIIIECKWLIHLSFHDISPHLTQSHKNILHSICQNFDITEFSRFKEIEETTKHDVKAIEYYLQEQFNEKGIEIYVPYIHFGLTSDDINNIAYAMLLDTNKNEVLTPLFTDVLDVLKDLALRTKNIPLLARTHGQPAVATTFGKEIVNYYIRLKKQKTKLDIFQFEAKCNGAVGNYNALHLTFPEKNWIQINAAFVKSLGLTSNLFTTQILPYDNWIEFFQTVALINAILIDLSTNIWSYIMLNVLKQSKEKNQIGSSTMPQKINPIDFENTEGNLTVANAHFEMYLRKLTSSRLQRDLSDSTVRRTFGEAFAYVTVGWKSIRKGLGKISVNDTHTKAELDAHWETLSEAIQTYLRSKNDSLAYEKLKSLTQGKTITKKSYQELLTKLGLDKEKKLTRLKPKAYTGLAQTLVDLALN